MQVADLKRNDRLKFRELFNSELELLQEMIKIQELATESREEHTEWANHLRFLQVPQITIGKKITMLSLVQ
jgi:hypothetical protein